jgi:hypothetical protein
MKTQRVIVALTVIGLAGGGGGGNPPGAGEQRPAGEGDQALSPVRAAAIDT